MKIAIDTVGMSMGGGITVLNTFLQTVLKIDSDIIFDVYVSSSSVNIFENKRVIKIVVQDTSSFYKRFIWQQFLFHKRAKKHKCNLVISFVNIGAIFPQLPQIIYFHQSLLFNSLRNLKQIVGTKKYYKLMLYKFLCMLSFISSKYIITQTDAVKNDILRQYPFVKNKIKRVYPGTPFIVKKNKKILSVTGNKTKPYCFLYFSHPSSYKNFEILIDVAEILKTKGIKVNFLFPFSKDYSLETHKNYVEWFTKIIKARKVNEYFVFTGIINAEKIDSLFMSIDAIIHPSLIESFPQSFTESMSYGKPILAADLPYAREICNTAALYFDPKDSDSIVRNIEIFVQNQKTREALIKNTQLELARFDSFNNWGMLYNLIIKDFEG